VPVFRTRLCDLLGIEYPILQSGMGGVAGPDLAAEVSRAGGLGIVAAVRLTADQVRQAIREVRRRSDRPFGVNLLIPPELRPPVPAERISDATVQAVQAALNPIRKDLGLPAASAWPAPPPDLIPEAFQVILDERVPVFSIGLGDPGREMVAECHRRGIKVIAMVTTVADARAVEATGLDAVVVQGGEAGGHRSYFEKPPSPEMAAVGAITLIPEVVDAVRIPVIAAGGIADGRGLVAALALGASGVLMGTRFIATRESMALETYKKTLLEKSADATTLTDAFSGRYARVIRNEFADRYAKSGAPVLPFLWQVAVARDIYEHAGAQGNREYFPMWAGQSVGLIRNLPGAAEVVESVVREARELLLERLPRAVKLGS
jgi:nitronate monooxygenase